MSALALTAGRERQNRSHENRGSNKPCDEWGVHLIIIVHPGIVVNWTRQRGATEGGMTVNHRKLAMAALRGEAVEHIPFIARMDLWHDYHSARGTLPRRFRGAGLWDIQRELGVGILGFGVQGISFFRLEHRNVETCTRTEGDAVVTAYRTPYGELRAVDRMTEELSDAARTPARVEYPFKGPRDYDALTYLLANTHVINNYDEYGRFVDSIGDDGLALPFTGHLPAHQLMLKFMGYEAFYLEMCDHEARVERLIELLSEQLDAVLALAAGCPAEAIEVGGNYDEDMTPPPVFERFFAPVYRKAAPALAAAGKALVVHGDGEMRQLLTLIRDCGVHAVEALTPRPMTSIDMTELRRLWQGKVTVWGGVPSVLLTSTFSDEEFDRALEELFNAVSPGDRFILGFGDNVPTDAVFERIIRLVDYWRANGACGRGTGV